MVLGLSRTRLKPPGANLIPSRPDPHREVLSHDWDAERGSTVFDAIADLIGGFPGYANRGAVLDAASIHVTEHYLLVDEGLPHGFGLPLTSIQRCVPVLQPGREDYALRLFYRSDHVSRLFTMHFRTTRLMTRSGRRSTRAVEAMLAGGANANAGQELPLEPNFTLPWDQTREFETENVIWTGRATAPIRVGEEQSPADIWLTTRSLIWGSGVGAGINRIPLTMVMDLVSTRIRNRLGAPVVYAAIGDDSSGRYDLPFTFDLQSPTDRNFRERGAFLVGLRSRGVPDGQPAGLIQPWRFELNPVSKPLAEEEMLDQLPTSTFDLSALGIESAPAPVSTPMLVAIESIETPHQTTQPESFRRRGRLGDRLARTPQTTIEVQSEALSALELPRLELPPDPVRVVDDTDELPMQIGLVQPSDTVLAEWPVQGLNVEPVPVAAIHEAIDDLLRPIESVASNQEPTEMAEPQPAAAPEAPNIDEQDPVETMAQSAILAIDEPQPLDIVVSRPKEMRSESVTWHAIRDYEASAVGALAEALRAIDDRVAGREAAPLSEVAPSSYEQARALAGIAALVANGDLDESDGRRRRDRLLVLGDVTVRLRTVIDLYLGGHLTLAELDAKRASLTKNLSDVLLPGLR